MARKYFGTDGIRGKVGDAPITPEFVMRLGYAAGVTLVAREKLPAGEHPAVLIGKDTRISGYMLEAALEAGFAAAGVFIKLTGLANAGEQEITKIKQKESFVDMLYKEDQETFRKTLAQCLKNNSPCEAWVRLSIHDDRTWLRMELTPKKRFTAFNKPSVDAIFTALINKSSSAQKSIFDESLLNLTGTLGKVGGW